MINIEQINKGNYLLKNYTILNEAEKIIALDFRNKNRKWMINNNIIEYKEHCDWIESLKRNPKTLYFLVFKNEYPFMAIDFHDIDYNNKEAFWGYFLGDENYKSEVLKIEKIIIEIAFNDLKLQKLLCVNDIDNPVINIHKFFGFQEDGIIKINDREFLKMYLTNKKR
jgi:RimJ/RimL family protein N-acetyltransferase